MVPVCNSGIQKYFSIKKLDFVSVIQKDVKILNCQPEKLPRWEQNTQSVFLGNSTNQAQEQSSMT